MGRVRRLLAIAFATALEILSEPLSLLVLLASLTMTVLAPAFHYHQFGEATRMARDAGLSALFVCGAVIAVFGTIRAFRREIESGTIEMALAHPVTRTGFFLAKTVGSFLAFAFFSLIVFLTSLTIIEGAAVGGKIAERTADVARLWGPSFAAGVGIIVGPLVAGAVLNRFARCRFVLSAFLVAAIEAVAAAGYFVTVDLSLALRLVPAAILIVMLSAVFLVAAAAFSVRFKANAAAAATGIVFLLLLPAVGNYYLSNALSGGRAIPWAYVGQAVLVTLPAILFFALLGIQGISRRDIS